MTGRRTSPPDPALLAAAIIRTDLYAFVRASFPIVAGGSRFLPNWHIEAIANAKPLQAGAIGQPKGHPKQSRNLRTIVRQVFDERMPIREGGRLRRMPAIEALLRTLLMRAFKGDLKAMSSLIVLFRQSGYGADQDEGAADLLRVPEFEPIIADFMVRYIADTAANANVNAAKAGSPPDAAPKQREG